MIDLSSLDPALSSLDCALDRHGFVLVRGVTESDFLTLAASLGDVVDDTPVRVIPGRRTYLSSPGAIPFHTDYPTADRIAWFCAHQDERDGASLLLDGWSLLDGLSRKTRRELSTLELPAMIRLGDPPRMTPILEGPHDAPRLFFAPWLAPLDATDGQRSALRDLHLAVEASSQFAHRVRLAPGDVLIVNNRRMLHGRAALVPRSTRALRRLWISSRRRSRPPKPPTPNGGRRAGRCGVACRVRRSETNKSVGRTDSFAF